MKTMDDCGRKYHPGKKDIKGFQYSCFPFGIIEPNVG